MFEDGTHQEGWQEIKRAKEQQRIKESLSPFENAFQVRTDRFDEKRHGNNKEARLNHICVHVKFVTANTAATGERAASAPPVVPQPKRFWLL
jgi:hypothetical protein